MENGKNCYILEFDCSNVNELATKITKIPKGKVKLPEDIYGKLLAPSKSTYKEKQDSRWLVEATSKYECKKISDVELCRLYGVDRYIPKAGYQWETSYERKETLYHNGFIKVIKEIKEEK